MGKYTLGKDADEKEFWKKDTQVKTANHQMESQEPQETGVQWTQGKDRKGEVWKSELVKGANPATYPKSRIRKTEITRRCFTPVKIQFINKLENGLNFQGPL